MPITAADIQFAQRLADAAGAAIRPYFRADHGVELKDDRSPVTRADREAEAAMRRLLDAEAPGDGVVGEEYGTKDGVTGRQWVLDPIDGTRSFTVGRAIFGTLIALVEDGWPLLGIIDQPVQRERWLGVAGRPTTFNGKPARTRSCAQLEGAIVATTSPQQKYAELRYSVRGLIPDGLLMRVSSIDLDPEAGYRVQTRFINDLYAAMRPEHRTLAFGSAVSGR